MSISINASKFQLTEMEQKLISILEKFGYPDDYITHVIAALDAYSYTLIQVKKEEQETIAANIEKIGFKTEKNCKEGRITGPHAMKYRTLKVIDSQRII